MPEAAPEHVDVLIVGAGLSGVGAGCHVSTKCPGKTFAILEAREAIGGSGTSSEFEKGRSGADAPERLAA